jgi:protein arginine kinase activator
MICEACNQNLATVHLTEIVQKAKKETHLCEECAREKGVTYSAQFSVKDFLGGLAKKGLKAAKAAASPPVDAPKPAPPEPAAPEPAACESCGITFAEFRQSGRLGCYRDYAHFREQLLPLMRKIHADEVQHTGRVPNHIGEQLERERQLTAYRKELEEAVTLENYERAAELRDLIKSLEGGGA